MRTDPTCGKNKNRRQKAGLCRDCPNYIVPGHARCASCMAQQARRYRAKYRERHKEERARLDALRKRYIKEGRCPVCGAPKAEEDQGRIRCQNCRERILVPQGLTRTWRLQREAHPENRTM